MHLLRTAGVALSVAVLSVTACAAKSSSTVHDPSTSSATAAAPTATADAPTTLVKKAGDQPNIVFFLVDDMRTDDLAYMPHVRKLIADQGMSFPNNISPHPLCCPARAEIYSGQYAQNNGVKHNSGKYGGFQALRHPDNTIAAWMDAAGYTTGLHGKFLNKYDFSDGPQKGWDIWDPLVKGTYSYTDFEFYNHDKFVDDYVTDRLTERSEASLAQMTAGDQPFFLMVDHIAPHLRKTPRDEWVPNQKHSQEPALTAPKYADEFAGEVPPSFKAPSFNEADMSDKPADIRNRPLVDPAKMRAEFLGRIRSLQSVDASVAETMEQLQASGKMDNTYVMFASDNGYALGEHRGHKKNMLSDEVLKVPLLVRGPGIEPGSVSNRITTLVDLSATLVDLTRAVPGAPMDGISFVPTLHGQKQGGRDTTLVQTGSKRTHGAHPGWDHRGVLTTRYLYGERARHENDQFLYDHAKDPWELNNVAKDPAYAAVVAEMRRRLHILETCAGSDCNRDFGPPPAPRPAAR